MTTASKRDPEFYNETYIKVDVEAEMNRTTFYLRQSTYGNLSHCRPIHIEVHSICPQLRFSNPEVTLRSRFIIGNGTVDMDITDFELEGLQTNCTANVYLKELIKPSTSYEVKTLNRSLIKDFVLQEFEDEDPFVQILRDNKTD
jgi:hypothetical protein